MKTLSNLCWFYLNRKYTHERVSKSCFGFPKAAEVDNISKILKHHLQRYAEIHSFGYLQFSETLFGQY
jgi:hypothetical protein